MGLLDCEENLYLFTPCTASKEVKGRFVLTEEAQEPLAECQELVCVCMCDSRGSAVIVNFCVLYSRWSSL